VNALFSAKREYKKVTEGIKEELPTEDDGESVPVDYTIEISNLELVQDVSSLLDFIESHDIE